MGERWHLCKAVQVLSEYSEEGLCLHAVNKMTLGCESRLLAFCNAFQVHFYVTNITDASGEKWLVRNGTCSKRFRCCVNGHGEIVFREQPTDDDWL